MDKDRVYIARLSAAKCNDPDECAKNYYHYKGLASNCNVFSSICAEYVKISDIWYDRLMELVNR